MREAIDDLRDMEASLFHSVNFLITQVAICAPSRKETSLATLEPLRDAAVDLIRSVVAILTNLPAVIDYFSCALGSQPIPESSSAYAAELYRAMLSNAQLVRDAFPALNAAILSIEAPLITELRGSYGLETFLRTLTWLPWSSSMRVDLLDNLPQLISAIHSYCRGAMRYLDTVVEFTVRLGDFISDEKRVGALEGRENIAKGLGDLGRSALRNMGYIGIHPHGLGQKGQALRVKTEYMGWDYLRRDPILRLIPVL
ncbi:hypothetical protein IW261DRAFT_1492337 [Armillaria novae-zelandiae]|uniref:Uncharacterized protein n=1 Tax=Armillaria novae-zelandiae TaxID=153914 RepID=A0AA39U2H6_9AGAR|nr:hypothetical protein IW261DRAFT_1492337 [Armillaria novae-zelandiae]